VAGRAPHIRYAPLRRLPPPLPEMAFL
jgi:hypothetical protein